MRPISRRTRRTPIPDTRPGTQAPAATAPAGAVLGEPAQQSVPGARLSALRGHDLSVRRFVSLGNGGASRQGIGRHTTARERPPTLVRAHRRNTTTHRQEASPRWKERYDPGTTHHAHDSSDGGRTPDVAAMAAFVDDPCHACSTGPDAIVAGRAHADLPDCHDRRLHPPEYLQVGAAVSHSGLGRAGRQTPGGGIRRPAEALRQGSV